MSAAVHAPKCADGAAKSKMAALSGSVPYLPGNQGAHPYSSPALDFGSVVFSLSLTPPLLNAIPFQQMGRLLSDKPFFPSVLLRSEPVALRSKAASRRVAAKACPSRKAGQRPPQRRFGVSSAANQPRSSHSLWTLGLTACPVL